MRKLLLAAAAAICLTVPVFAGDIEAGQKELRWEIQADLQIYLGNIKLNDVQQLLPVAGLMPVSSCHASMLASVRVPIFNFL